MSRYLAGMILWGLTTALPAADPDTKAIIYKRVPPMSFDCSQLPDICTSMCWGAYCTEPAFDVNLSFDNPTEATKSARRTSAGCQPRPNRCSVNHNPPFSQTGYNCDEYPFASTSNADAGGQTNRCVPKSQNSAQGAIISNYISSTCGCQPCQFIVGFGNPDAAGVKYCDVFPNRHDNCVPDGNTFKGNSPDVQPPADNTKRSLSKPRGGIYMTESGTKVSFAADMEPGTHIRHAVIRSDTLQARAKQDARSALERRQATCDTGDGDEWDNDAAAPSTAAAIAVATSAVVALQSTVAAAANTTSSDPAGVTAVAVRRNLDKRTTAFDAYRMPVYEFVDDFVAHKMV